MTDGSGINKTQIWVTVITVIGGLLTALIVNADKWFFRQQEAPKSTEAPAPTSTPPAEAPRPQAANVDLSGEWRSDDGSRFNFTQNGSSYEYTHSAIHGTLQSAGQGAIEGRDLSHSFETLTGETGTCTARINEAANKISGNCLHQDGNWNFVIER